MAASTVSSNWDFMARRQLRLITPSTSIIFTIKGPFTRGIPLFDTLAAMGHKGGKK
jgi:hypothetical protein